MKQLAANVVMAAAMAAPAWAGTRTGVEKAEVRYEQREAVVTFDDTRTNMDALAKATENAGYPSAVKH